MRNEEREAAFLQVRANSAIAAHEANRPVVHFFQVNGSNSMKSSDGSSTTTITTTAEIEGFSGADSY